MNITNKFTLEGKKAFVTGAARGIGRGIALSFAQAGADVALVDNNYEELKETVEQFKLDGFRAIGVKTDISDPDEVNNMIETIMNNFETLDIAFNNAGICINEDAREMSFKSWEKVININLTGVFLTAQAAGKIMIENNKGSIINTASMSGHIVNHPQPQSAYNASKAGVIQLTKSLAVEWAGFNVRVNSISPGYISTEMTLKAKKEWIAEWEKAIPMKRMGNPEELCGAAIYLASDASTYTTGADMVLDGGYTCW